jgi:secernin
MGCDMVVALGRATVDGQTLVGMNSDWPVSAGQLLSRVAGREFAPGEKVPCQGLILPQVRQTCSVLANQPDGWWGYSHGVNQHGVVAGCIMLCNRLPCPEPGLTGGDFVRLILERCHSARHAVDTLTDLIERCGQAAAQCGSVSGGRDHGFLIADAQEAFAVESAGHHWVYQEIQEVRAVSNVCVIHQDWDRISHGLATMAIEHGWWPGDGSKLDFAATLTENPVGQASGLRRWGRATLLLEQQNGHIDMPFIRKILADHYESTHFEIDPLVLSHGPVPLCQHGNAPGGGVTTSSMVMQLSADLSHLPVVWCAFGPPCSNVHFPVFLEGEVPYALAAGPDEEGFTSWSPSIYSAAAAGAAEGRLGQTLRQDAKGAQRIHDSLSRLQARIDAEAAEFSVEGARLKQAGNKAEVQRLAGQLMKHHMELFDAVVEELTALIRRPHIHPQRLIVSEH